MAVLKQSKKSQRMTSATTAKKGVTAQKRAAKPKQSAPVPKKGVVKPKKAVAKPTKRVAKPKKVAAKPTVVPSPKSPKPVGRVLASTPDVAVAVVETTRITLQKAVIPLAPKPTAKTCPLVLDGIIPEEDFSPRDCFSCDEFDCRFYAAEERSGPLGSRLFAGGDDDENEDSWDLFGDEGEEPEADDVDDWGGAEDDH